MPPSSMGPFVATALRDIVVMKAQANDTRTTM